MSNSRSSCSCLATACSILAALLLFAPACSEKVAAASQSQSAPSASAQSAPPPPFKQPLLPFQEELLRLAYRAASAFPLDPHHKNRARAQEVVVVGCFELGQPQLALEFANGIVGWRRGSAYADYACYCITHGERDQALTYVKRAEDIVQELEGDPNEQSWRRDLIVMKMARAYMLLGDRTHAEKLSASIDATSANAVDDDWAKTVAEGALLAPADKIGEVIEAVQKSFPGMSLGQQNTAVVTLVRLHERCFVATAQRSAIEGLLTTTFDKLPPGIRLPAIAQLASTCVDHDDKTTALRLLAVARKIAEAHTWRPSDHVPILARLCELRGRAGEVAEARADAEAAMKIYQSERDSIIDIDRADTIRPLAIAWHALGEATTADGLLALALEEAMENPNSRPRADDFVDTAVAMARNRIEPSPALLIRMREICEGLGNPW
jgi:hypothetical protein